MSIEREIGMWSWVDPRQKKLWFECGNGIASDASI